MPYAAPQDVGFINVSRDTLDTAARGSRGSGLEPPVGGPHCARGGSIDRLTRVADLIGERLSHLGRVIQRNCCANERCGSPCAAQLGLKGSSRAAVEL